MKTLRFKKIFIAMALAGAVLGTEVSHAAIISDMFQTGVNGVQDTDRDLVRNSSGTSISSGEWALGDSIVSALQFNSVDWLNSAGNVIQSKQIYLGHAAPYGLFALSTAVITNIYDTGIDDQKGGTVKRLTFGPSSGTDMISLYEGNLTNIFSLATTAAQDIAAISSLTKIATFGLGKSTDFWTADVGHNITSLVGGYGGGQHASGTFGLSITSNNGGLPVQKDGVYASDGLKHDIAGDASAYASAANGWLTNTNTTVTFSVPEPTSLALLGIGLLGFGLSRKQA